MENTTNNAARCLQAFGAPADVLVYSGASKPLLGQHVPDPDIQGEDGLGGVEDLLPDANDDDVKARIVPTMGRSIVPAIEGIRNAAVKAIDSGKVLYLAVTGPLTNLAIFLLAYPDLAKETIIQIVIMGSGGSVGK